MVSDLLGYRNERTIPQFSVGISEKWPVTIYLPSGISEIFFQMVSTPGVRLNSEVPMSRDTFQQERNFRVQNVDSLKKHHKLTDYKVIHQYVISKHPFKLKRGHRDMRDFVPILNSCSIMNLGK